VQAKAVAALHKEAEAAQVAGADDEPAKIVWPEEGLFQSLRSALSLEWPGAGTFQVPTNTRLMLACMCEIMGSSPAGLAMDFGQFHPFEKEVLLMARDALTQLVADLSARASAAAELAAARIEDSISREALEQDLRRAESNADEMLAEATRVSELHAQQKEELSQKRREEREFVGEVRSCQKLEASADASRQALEKALAIFKDVESSGPPRKGARQLLQEVELQMEAVRLSESLFASSVRAVLPALRTMPAERSRAHEAALAAAEGVFRDAVKDRAEQHIKHSQQLAGARRSLERAKSDVAAAERLAEERRQRERDALEKHAAALKSLEEASASLRRFGEESRNLVECQRASEASLRRVRRALQGLRQLFGQTSE